MRERFERNDTNMGKWTKILLSGLGWAVAGPIGALVGYLLGSAFSGGNQLGTGTFGSFGDGDGTGSRRGPYRNTGTRQDQDVALMVLIAAVMKADGAVKRSELDMVKRFLLQNYGEQDGKKMLGVLHELVQKEIPIDDVCRQIKVNTDYVTRYQMYDFLFSLAGADGEFHQSELLMLRLIGQYLGISRGDYASTCERHGVPDGSSSYREGPSGGGRAGGAGRTAYSKDPYRVLGIDSSATDDEVRKAYRRMAMKYHPDKVAGMSEEIQRNAAEQMKEINQAYEEIKARRASLK